MLKREAYTTAELAALLERPVMAVHRIAERENWTARTRNVRGGGKEWLISSMPPATRQAVINAIIKSANNASHEPSGEGAGQVVIPMPAGLAGGNEAEPPGLYRTIQNSVNKKSAVNTFNGGSGRVAAGDIPVRVAPPVCQASSNPPDGQCGPPALPQRQLVPQHQLTDKQRAVMDARMAFVREVEKLIGIVDGKTMAINTLVIHAKLRQLPPRLQRLVEVANDRPKQGRSLSARTLFNWCALAQRGPAALAPNYKQADMRVPGWLPEFMKYYQQPQKPSIPEAYGEFCKNWPITPPSIHAVRRVLDKMGVVDKNRGRMGHRALKSIQPFVRRDTSKLKPNDVFTGDGHTFDAEIAHPDNGRPFRPEVTMITDVATRRVVGFSIALAESALAVMGTLSLAIEHNGICSVFYVDKGSGYINDVMKAPGVGLVDRLGFEMTHSLPYNSQARGQIERAHQTILVSLARTMPTYVNKAMDTEAKQLIFKITRKQIKETGRSNLLMPWNDFRIALAKHIDEYNDRPHRGLPKVWDESLGKHRHVSPNEMLQHHILNGWRPMMLTEDEAHDLFRPYEHRKVSRGEVSLWNNVYFDKALADFHGEIVRVGFDVADPAQVYVRDTSGRLICVAKLNANRRDYFPQSFLQQAADKRLKGQQKRLEQKLANLLPAPEEYVVPSEEQIQQVAQIMSAPVIEDKAAQKRPAFFSNLEKYRYLASHRENWLEHDEQWLETFSASPEYDNFNEIFEREGIAWEQIKPTPKSEEKKCVDSL